MARAPMFGDLPGMSPASLTVVSGDCAVRGSGGQLNRRYRALRAGRTRDGVRCDNPLGADGYATRSHCLVPEKKLQAHAGIVD